MTVAELIEQLQEQPQEAEVYYLLSEGRIPQVIFAVGQGVMAKVTEGVFLAPNLSVLIKWGLQ